jgi:hypothetical protein
MTLALPPSQKNKKGDTSAEMEEYPAMPATMENITLVAAEEMDMEPWRLTPHFRK